MKQSREYMVGVFVAAGIILFSVFVFSIGKFTGPSRILAVEFGYVDGLGADAPVQYAGYRVGKVESVKILPGPPVRLRASLAIPKDLPVTKSSEVIITSMGLMGEKVIEIIPAPGGVPVAPGEVLQGSDPILLSKMFGQVRNLFDESTSGNIRQVAQNILTLTQDLNVFSAKLRKISEERGGDVEKILTNFSKSSENLPELMASAESAAKKIDKAAGSLSELAEHLKGMAGENRPDIKEIVQNLNETSGNLKALSDDVRRHPWKLIRKSSGEPDAKKK